MFRKYGLSIVLGVLFLLALIGQVIAQHMAGDDAATIIGEMLANWQSEYLQLFSFVVLASWLNHRGSPQSKTADEETKAQLDRIERKLGRMEGDGT